MVTLKIDFDVMPHPEAEWSSQGNTLIFFLCHYF